MESYRPDMMLSEKESIGYYKEIVSALDGVDLYLAETMGCIDEAIYVLKAMQSLGMTKKNSKEIWISFSLNNDGDLRSGESVNEAVRRLEAWMAVCNLSIVSFNCCLPEAVDNFFEHKGFDEESLQILRAHDVKLGLYPNILKMGDMNMSEWSMAGKKSDDGIIGVREISPKQWSQMFVSRWLRRHGQSNRIRMIGGCCGFTPEHMRYIAKNYQMRSKL